ncbi:dihydrodipicolinate synthase family protein [Microbacterium invictum]|uniref:4-hydroxy-tetrahydrodipicolinate synthase n=1 Tax=Microbacterium invictum TaxID=515415 RepID=A0AA40SS10_9MICO|nr:dihydrodipicolinate synthase family protein [Microbacterium invictum]MBB4141189.1 4-hydroxy-tetrahydrodipicolinate synthase [Microbacterium invictum]
MNRLPAGPWPVMLTPYRDDLGLDFDGLDAYTDWLIELGAAGLFAVSLSSEMYDLSPDEQLAVAARVRTRADGRAPVIASATATGDWRAQADRIAEIAATGVDAVVLITSLVVAPDATENAWIDTVERILDAVPGVDLGIYECPLPFKRLLPVHTVRWLAQTGRFTFYKDTSHSLETMTERLNVIGDTRMRLYNAAIGSLVPSIRAGAAGLSGYAANVYPDLVAWLCHHADDHDADVLRLQHLLTVAEHCINLRYPASAKYLLDAASRLTWRARSRWKPEHIGAHEGEPLRQLAELMAEIDMGRARLHPAR